MRDRGSFACDGIVTSPEMPLLSGGFGQAIATGAVVGAGFGMTVSLINSIFS
jgi:hypothetical protein